jgi:hypothetical protein
VRQSLLIAGRGLVPLPLRSVVIALQGLFIEEEPQPYLFGTAGGTASVPPRPKVKPRPAWRPPLPIIPRPVDEDEALMLCGVF